MALVTGAGSGIGAAIARALAQGGAMVYLVGRRQSRLDALQAQLLSAGHQAVSRPCDLDRDEDICSLRDQIGNEQGHLDLLVHSAGTILLGAIESASIGDFDKQYRTNVRAPYFLTQALLPFVKLAQGKIVFINSSAGLHT